MNPEIDYQAIGRNVDKYIERCGDWSNLGDAHYAGRVIDKWAQPESEKMDSMRLGVIRYCVAVFFDEIINGPVLENLELKWYIPSHWPSMVERKSRRNLIKGDPLRRLIGYMEIEEGNPIANREYFPYLRNCFAFDAYKRLMEFEKTRDVNLGLNERVSKEIERIPPELFKSL